MYNRILSTKLGKSSKSILLLGPRQTGKSTLLNSLNPDLTINLAQEEEYFIFQSNLSELENRVEAQNPKTIFIGEIQRIPRLTNSIQVILDNNKNIKFYMSGSSARKLRKGRANLLPGRIFTYHLAPLCLSELKKDWNDLNSMKYGFLPGVVTLSDDREKKKILQSYANTYLKEEILAESLVRGVDGFVRFLREAACISGGFLDYSKLSKKSKIPRQSTVRHFEILVDTLIAKKLQNDPDLDENHCDLVKHPRFFFFDIGVVNALRGSFDTPLDRVGPLWEHVVFNQLQNSIQSYDSDWQIYNFRTRGGLEIDFILSMSSQKVAIECKAATHIDKSDYRNLFEIQRYYPKIKRIVIYRGKNEKKDQGIWILPLPKALKILGLS